MYKLVLHPNLTIERWQNFTLEKRVIMILNEIQRLIFGIRNRLDKKTLKETIERAFELCDLTINSTKGNFRKELLRWRDLLAKAYIDKQFSIQNSQDLYESLLKLNSRAYNLLQRSS